MAKTKVSTKGQVILPKAVREALRWMPGTELVVEQGTDCVILRLSRSAKRHELKDIVGILKHDGPPITTQEMNEAIAQGAVARYERSFK